MLLPHLSDLDLVVFDFDGVMTDNRVLVFDNGNEAVFCSRADGQGCDLLRNAGLAMIILSTESNSTVAVRAQKLRIDVLQSIPDKALALRQLLTSRSLDPARVMYVGNDVNDLGAMGLIGWPVAPADAHEDVVKIAKFVTKAVGGHGVVREIADLLIER